MIFSKLSCIFVYSAEIIAVALLAVRVCLVSINYICCSWLFKQASIREG